MKPTQLRSLYDALGHLKQSEQVALAEFHAGDSSMLEHRIRNDIGTVAMYPDASATVLVDDSRETLPVGVDVTNLRSTIEFASALGAGLHRVEGRDELTFRYLAREISPLRGIRPERRSMDLLLCSQDGTPGFGELKRGADNLPYYALIQLLVHTVELATPRQRSRLVPLGVPPGQANEPADLYLIAYGDQHITHYQPSLDATEAVARRLMERSTQLHRQVRQITYLKATPTAEHTLAFTAEFVVTREG